MELQRYCGTRECTGDSELAVSIPSLVAAISSYKANQGAG